MIEAVSKQHTFRQVNRSVEQCIQSRYCQCLIFPLRSDGNGVYTEIELVYIIRDAGSQASLFSALPDLFQRESACGIESLLYLYKMSNLRSETDLNC